MPWLILLLYCLKERFVNEVWFMLITCVYLCYIVFSWLEPRVGWCGGGEKSVCVFVCVSVINHKGKTAIINHSQL